MENEKKELIQEEEDPRPLTDEEYKEYQEKDADDYAADDCRSGIRDVFPAEYNLFSRRMPYP